MLSLPKASLLITFAAAVALVQIQLASDSFRLDWIHEDTSKLLRSLQLDVFDETDSRIVFFLHIHKAGGTTLCETAKVNDMRTTGTLNCNVQPEDWRCCGDNDSFLAQREFAKRTNLNFVACEGPMYDAMDTKNYRYITSLRPGKSRYKSHWKMICREKEDFNSTFGEWWDRQPDNWSTRHICGTACFNQPKFQLTREQFQYTLDRLSMFENIVLLDDYERTYNKLASDLGWNRTVPDVLKNLASVRKGRTCPSEGDTPWDTNMSILDDVLYDYARQLTKFGSATISPGMEEALRKYFLAKNNCTHRCCADRCSDFGLPWPGAFPLP